MKSSPRFFLRNEKNTLLSCRFLSFFPPKFCRFDRDDHSHLMNLGSFIHLEEVLFRILYFFYKAHLK